MHLSLVQRILGLVIVAFGLTMLPPVVVDVVYGGTTAGLFLMVGAALVAMGTALWLPVRRVNRDLRLRDGFLIVALFWALLGLGGALPFFFSASTPLSFTDAVFESVAGVTTTNASVMRGLETVSYTHLTLPTILRV